ncbi:UDP-glucuronate 4-epimerase 4-like [Castanea sativa]|uniref:UDP-glucuronate 4-epimerase 4-like n=1 Tax=Castanea sativa TaxID=21020 RepID=UPI003F6517C4
MTSFVDLMGCILPENRGLDLFAMVVWAIWKRGNDMRAENQAEIGVVIRDSKGQVMVSLAQRIPLPNTAIEVEALAARHAMELALETGLNKGVFGGTTHDIYSYTVVWASSSSVYGLNTKLPFSEEDRTDQPASLYAATKKADEEIAHSYNHIYGLSLTGLRFFTVYGPWGRPDMAYFEFTKNILKGKNITVFQGPGGISVGRDFTYIDDVVKGCIAALDTAGKSIGREGKRKGLKAPLRVFNIGNTSPESVEKLVGILERLLKKKAMRDVQEMPKNGDVMFTHANISLATRELGYKPTTDLETGLKKFVEWYVDWIQKD